MKQTEVGLIPDDWDVVNILNILIPNKDRLKIGPFGSQLKKEYLLENGDYKVFGQENVYDNDFSKCYRYLTKEHFNTLKSCEIKKGDFVISTMGTIGKCAIVPDKIGIGIMDSHLVRLRLQETIDKLFFKYYFQSSIIQNQISALSVGGIMDGLSTKIIKKLNVIKIPQQEQKRIAEALSDIDSLITGIEEEIEKKKNIKTGVMQELLTGKRRLPGFAKTDKTKMTELGEIPEDWEVRNIGSFANVFDGTHQTPNYVKTGVPFYSVENVSSNDFQNTKFITQQEHNFLTKKVKINKGDILMTRIGSIGVCKYVDWEPNASFYVSLALLKCDNTVDARFIALYSTTVQFKKELEQRSLFYAIPQKINLGPISEIELTIPSSTEEQSAIAEILSDMDGEINELEKKLAKYQKIKNGMMQQLLTGKIRIN